MAKVAEKTIVVQYFALLREERGKSNETLTTQANNVGELYHELKSQHGFTLPLNNMTVAINDCFSNWDTLLQDNDTVVFIPPVAGG